MEEGAGPPAVPAAAPAGVDPARLVAWMDGEGIGSGPLTGLVPIAGGTQNIMVRFNRDGRGFVLRRGPLHLRPRSNEQLVREMRVLHALATTDVPHPRLVATCPDPEVLDGAVFYLMEPVDGFNATVALPPLHAGDVALRHRMGLEAVDALARLGAVDHVAIGLGDLGRPVGFLERQVPRWRAELDSYSRHRGYPGPEIPAIDEVADWLDANRPASWAPGLMHGDYHLANLMFAPGGPAVAAIVDWEMCTTGDPLLDLGWLLATWPSGDDATGIGGALGAAGGLPRPDELVARYASATTRDLAAVPWYAVLACFKLGIVLEGTHARACAGEAPRSVGDLLHGMTLQLFARAETLIRTV